VAACFLGVELRPKENLATEAGFDMQHTFRRGGAFDAAISDAIRQRLMPDARQSTVDAALQGKARGYRAVDRGRGANVAARNPEDRTVVGISPVSPIWTGPPVGFSQEILVTSVLYVKVTEMC
jgi:hypothetical protein